MRIVIFQPLRELEASVPHLHRLPAWGHNVRTVATLKALLGIVEQVPPPDLVLVANAATEPDVLECLRHLRSRLGWPRTQLLAILDGEQASHDLKSLLRSAYDDFLTLPLQEEALRLKLHTLERLRVRFERLEASKSDLHFAATHDALTSVWNKAAITGQLYRELARSQRSGTDLCMLMCDIDDFKSVNDTHGHLVGDEVLRQVAERLEGALRTYDLLGRYGGEEFLVVLPDCDVAQGLRIAERARERVTGFVVSTSAGEIDIRVSIGVASLSQVPAEQLSRRGPDALIDAADQALYQAKIEGKDQCVVWSTGSRPPVRSGRRPRVESGTSSRVQGGGKSAAS